METPRQRTLDGTASLSGIALHTGHRVRLAVHPGEADAGIVFRRTDLAGSPSVAASIHNVVDTRRGTTIAQGEAAVHTVEHLLAAFNALGIDNAVVDMDGPEPPVGDGSSDPFVKLVRTAGAREQNAERRFAEVKEILYYQKDDTRLVVVPDDAFRIACTVKFGGSAMDCQYLGLEVTEESFVKDLSLGRTFCQYHEIEALVKANLIRGGSLDNAVIIKGNAILSREGLRYADEFVRHKMLDIVGDFFLLGRRLKGQVIAIKPGHPSNVAMARIISEKLGI